MINNKMKIIFLDADGTLWNFPYNHESGIERKLKDAKLDSSTIEVLRKIKEMGIKAIIVSYQSHLNKTYSKIKLKKWLTHFDIIKYIDEIYVADKEKEPKSNIITKVLNKNKIEKSEAIFVGDRYNWDYLEAEKAGIRGLLLNKEENKQYNVEKINLSEIIKYLK